MVRSALIPSITINDLGPARRQETKMRLQKPPLNRFLIFIFPLLIFVWGFQVKPAGTISGVIENIDSYSNSVVVNKAQILVSSQTKIMDESGKALKIEDLNPSLSVAIEGFRNSNGFTATKIIVKTPKKRP